MPSAARSCENARLLLATLLLLLPVVAHSQAEKRSKIPKTEWVELSYQPAKTVALKEFPDWMQKNELLEAFGSIIESKVNKNPPLRLGALECGQENAFYVPQHRAIVLCYELVRGHLNNIAIQLKGKVPDDTLLGSMIGGIAFVFFHELGHALLHISNAPFVGREEDVADQFASYMILEGVKRPHATSMLLGAIVSHDDKQLFYSRRHFADEHSLNPQRRYNLACWGFGSSPEDFQHVAQFAGLPQQRAMRCKSEYSSLKRGVEDVFREILK